MKNQRVYISGCGGMLGESFHRHFSVENDLKCTDIEANDMWLSRQDVRDFDSFRADVIRFAPNYIFHLAAITDLEKCHVNETDCYQTNTLGVENAVHIANELEIPLLYISTAGIFDGMVQTYDDWATPNPIGPYGRSKFWGERYVETYCHAGLTCRAGWMMGGGVKDKKFVSKIVKQILSGSRQIHAVVDKFGTPTYTLDFAKNVELLIDSGFWGTYNLVCEGHASRFDVAKRIVDIANAEDVSVIPVSSSYFDVEYFSPRPRSEQLVCKKLKLRGLYSMRNWEICLEEYLKESFNELFL